MDRKGPRCYLSLFLPLKRCTARSHGEVWGLPYSEARGEILRPSEEDPERRLQSKARPSVKNESPGSQGD